MAVVVGGSDGGSGMFSVGSVGVGGRSYIVTVGTMGAGPIRGIGE